MIAVKSDRITNAKMYILKLKWFFIFVMLDNHPKYKYILLKSLAGNSCSALFQKFYLVRNYEPMIFEGLYSLLKNIETRKEYDRNNTQAQYNIPVNMDIFYLGKICFT